MPARRNILILSIEGRPVGRPFSKHAKHTTVTRSQKAKDRQFAAERRQHLACGSLADGWRFAPKGYDFCQRPASRCQPFASRVPAFCQPSASRLPATRTVQRRTSAPRSASRSAPARQTATPPPTIQQLPAGPLAGQGVPEHPSRARPPSGRPVALPIQRHDSRRLSHLPQRRPPGVHRTLRLLSRPHRPALRRASPPGHAEPCPTFADCTAVRHVRPLLPLYRGAAFLGRTSSVRRRLLLPLYRGAASGRAGCTAPSPSSAFASVGGSAGASPSPSGAGEAFASSPCGASRPTHSATRSESPSADA